MPSKSGIESSFGLPRDSTYIALGAVRYCFLICSKVRGLYELDISPQDVGRCNGTARMYRRTDYLQSYLIPWSGQSGINETLSLPGQTQGRALQFPEGSGPLFEHIIGRVHYPAVNITKFLQAEEVGCCLSILEHIGCRLVYRYCSCIRRRVYFLASVDR